jgi:hypothetical protein
MIEFKPGMFNFRKQNKSIIFYEDDCQTQHDVTEILLVLYKEFLSINITSAKLFPNSVS